MANIKELKENYERKIQVIETRNKSVKTSAKEDRVITLGNDVGESNTDEAIRCSNSPEEVDPAPAPGKTEGNVG